MDHNPDNLTPAQVGNGWRLLDQSETPGRFRNTQWWEGHRWTETGTWGASRTSCTLRTQVPKGQLQRT